MRNIRNILRDTATNDGLRTALTAVVNNRSSSASKRSRYTNKLRKRGRHGYRVRIKFHFQEFNNRLHRNNSRAIRFCLIVLAVVILGESRRIVESRRNLAIISGNIIPKQITIMSSS